jgi:hypothetical protein
MDATTRENGNALMVKLPIAWANYRQSSRTTSWTPPQKASRRL